MASASARGEKTFFEKNPPQRTIFRFRCQKSRDLRPTACGGIFDPEPRDIENERDVLGESQSERAEESFKRTV